MAWFYSYGLCIKEMSQACNGDQFKKWFAINDAVHEKYHRPVNYFSIDYVGLEDESGVFRSIVAEINRKNVERYGKLS